MYSNFTTHMATLQVFLHFTLAVLEGPMDAAKHHRCSSMRTTTVALIGAFIPHTCRLRHEAHWIPCQDAMDAPDCSHSRERALKHTTESTTAGYKFSAECLANTAIQNGTLMVRPHIEGRQIFRTAHFSGEHIA